MEFGLYDDMQKPIVVEDLSPLAMYALHRANLLLDVRPAESARTTPATSTSSMRRAEHDGNAPAAAAAVDDTQRHVLLTDGDIKVTITRCGKIK